MSGYDVTRFAEQSVAHFWPIVKSQVYSELSRLEELGLISGTDVAQEGVPDKRVFKPTPQGLAALDAWLLAPGYATDRVRSGFLIKFFFGHRMDSDRVIELVKEFRAESQKDLDRFGPLVEAGRKQMGLTFPMASATFGMHHLEANIRWADETLADLQKRRAKGSTLKPTKSKTSRKGTGG